MLQNVSIAIVGPKTPLTVSEEADLTRYLSLVEGEERRGGGAAATGDAGAPDAGDERDPQPQVNMLSLVAFTGC